jgi:uncharacterized protein YggE
MHITLRIAVLALALTAASPSPILSAAQASEAAPAAATITVMGYGSAEQAPTYAVINYSLTGEGTTQTDALAAFTTRREKVEAALKGLAGLTGIEIKSDDLSFTEMRGPKCDDDRSSETHLSTGDCAVIGYVVSVSFKVTLRPASRQGDAISMASQYGASGLELASTGVDDMPGLRAQATAAAMRDAQDQAQKIAAAAGGRLGRILKVEDPIATGPRVYGVTTVGSDQLSLRGNTNPIVRLDLNVAPVRANASYAVTFELLK